MPPDTQVLITGGSGMLANAFADRLTRANISHVLLSRAQLDVASSEHVEQAIATHKPTVLINCAAYTKVDHCEKDPQAAFNVNGTGPEVLATGCKKHGIRLVHFSTDYVFDGSKSRPLLPTDPIGPASAYGKSKLAGETAIQRISPPGWLILRTAWLYGPGGPNFVATMVNAARAGKPLKVVADQIGSPTYTRDLADATLAMLNANATGIHHAANAGQTNWCEFARHILKVWGIDHPVAGITTADWFKIKPDSAIRPAYSVLDTSSLTHACGFTFRNWDEALVDFHSGHTI
jgi:dTDP-4-dehydrorhamnose reductase